MLLTKYIAWEFLLAFFVGVAIVTGVFISSNDLREIIHILVELGVDGHHMFVCLALNVPKVVAINIPVVSLLGATIVFRKMAIEGETLCLRVNGVSLRQFMVVPITIGIITSMISFVLFDSVIPHCQRTFIKMMYIASVKVPVPRREGMSRCLFWKRGGKRLSALFLSYGKNTNALKPVLLLLNPGSSFRLVVGESVEKSGDTWVLHNGFAYDCPEDYTKGRNMEYETFVLPAAQNPNKPKYNPDMRSPKEMTFLQLGQHINWSPFDAKSEVAMRFWEKLSRPLGCLILILVAAPLAFIAPRNMNKEGMSYIAVVVILFYVMQSSFSTLGDAGRVPAVIAAWLPNVVLFTFSVIMLLIKTDSFFIPDFKGWFDEKFKSSGKTIASAELASEGGNDESQPTSERPTPPTSQPQNLSAHQIR